MPFLNTLLENGDLASIQLSTDLRNAGPNNEIRGLIGRKRLTNWPLVEYKGELEGLDLPTGRGLYETSHFVLFGDNVIGYESNYLAPRLRHWCDYLQTKANDLVNRIDYQLLWTRDLAQKIRGVNAVTLFTFRAHRDLEEVISEHDQVLGNVFRSAKAWA